MTIMSYQPSIGDRVIIHDPKLADQLRRDGQVAVVINRRRQGARIAFLPDRATYWIDNHRLYPHPNPDEADSGDLAALSRVLSILEPEEAELESSDFGTEVHALCLRFHEGHRTALVEALGDRLQSWEVIPYGMALITVVVRIRPA